MFRREGKHLTPKWRLAFVYKQSSGGFFLFYFLLFLWCYGFKCLYLGAFVHLHVYFHLIGEFSLHFSFSIQTVNRWREFAAGWLHYQVSICVTPCVRFFSQYRYVTNEVSNNCGRWKLGHLYLRCTRVFCHYLGVAIVIVGRDSSESTLRLPKYHPNLLAWSFTKSC